MDTFPMPICAEHAVLQRDTFLWQHAAYDSWFLIIPIQGSFVCSMQGKTWTISAGELCFFPPGVVFERQVLEPLTLHYIRVVWSYALEQETDSPYYWLGRIVVQDDERLQSTLQLLRTMEQIHVPDKREMVLHYVRDICLQCVMEHWKAQGTSAKMIADPVVAKAVEHMQHFYHTPLSIAELAAEYGLSHALFTRRFTIQMGVSPIAYLTDLRIQSAKALLAETAYTVAQVAEACGYEDPFYFSKRFHQITGLSPQMYRQRLKEL